MSSEAKAKKGRTTKPRKDQAADRIKTSVLLSRSVDVKIRALAGIRGVDKSTLINSLLEGATRGVVVQIRNPGLTDQGTGQGGRQPEEDEEAAEIG
jgi:hypothetical protein